MQIHQLIRTAMSEKQWTVTELGEACNVATATAARWANGNITPKPKRWPDIEEALDLPAGALARVFYGGEVNPPDDPPGQGYATLELAEKGFETVRELTARVVALEAEVAALKRRRPGRASDG